MTQETTQKKTLSDFWYYYKWYVLGGLLLLIVIGNFIFQRAAVTEKDATISFVTMTQMTQEQYDGLSVGLEKIVPDVNGDGEIQVALNLYYYNPSQPNGNADMFSATAVHLAAEIGDEGADFYLSDLPHVMAEATTLHSVGFVKDFPGLAAIAGVDAEKYQVYVFHPENTPLLDLLR